MQELARELARSNQDLQQFAYVASHDLQEPLRTVSSFCDLLEKKATGKLDDSSEKYLRHIVDGTERMQVMVNALLAYAKVESQGKPLSPVKLSDSLNQALSSLSKLIDDSGAHIDAGDLPEVLGDSTQLSIVFQNLISNAIKYRSSDVIRVRIYAEKFDKVCRISVSDNGIGMDMKFAEKIFVIFQRLHSRSKYPGAGIGLAICKRIIERHGGEISVQSSLNNGSTFIFTLECPN
jgi:light-regulated signal transduction histidine kinase (bacteriophytochrome)